MSYNNSDVRVGGKGDLIASYSTYRTKVLPNNLVDRRNVLTQLMMNTPNTKYVIKWDYVLNESITLPAGCLIEFDGGSIRNDNGGTYTLTGQDTILLFYIDKDKVIKDVELLGTFIFKGSSDIADEEDITGRTGVLKFADKDYDPENFSGLGRVYLRKNIGAPVDPDNNIWCYKPSTDELVYLMYRYQGVYYHIYDEGTGKGLVLHNNIVKETDEYNVANLPEPAQEHNMPYIKNGDRLEVTLPDNTVVDDSQINNTEIFYYVYDESEQYAGKNILTQDMISKPNTIYIIQYDYVISPENENTIEVPEGCVLKFDGGSISKGTLIGHDTIIVANPIKIFNSDITLDSSWNIAEAYPEWFGAKGDGITDDTISFTKCLQYFKNVKGVLEHTYKATITFTNSYSRISNLNLIGFITFNEGLRFINIDNCKIDASDCEHGIDVPHNVIKLTINDVYVHNAIRNGINLIDCWDSTLTKISTSSNGEIGFYAEQFNNGYFQGTAYDNGIGIKIWGTTACTVKATAQENLKTGVDLRSVHASLMNLYLEQNGYQGSDLCEKSQIAIGYNESPCIGDNITVYGMGGSGSSMESPYGCTLFYAENCNVNGYFIRHTESGFRVTSNTVRCKANVLDLNHEDYGYDRNLERQITAITVDSNTPFDIPVNSYCIPVVLGETPYAASLVINTSTSALIRVKDSEGNNVSVQCLVYIASDGIRRSR